MSLSSRSRRALHAMFTGADEKPITDLDGAIVDKYGTNRLGNPNYRAAAADLGISAGTLRRWTHGTQTPRGDNATKATRVVRNAQRRQKDRLTNPKRRARLTDQAKLDQINRRGYARMGFAGTVRISNDARARSIPPEALGDVSPANIAQLHQAWVSGDDKAIEQATENILNDHYFGGGGYPAEVQGVDNLHLR